MDIYFQDGYGKLYEKAENGTAETFHFQCELGEVKHQYIQREIPIRLPGGESYYDLITPYGYGGPIMIPTDEGNRNELCNAFGEVFHRHCYSQHIVSEFVRFHPIINNASDFNEIYDPICIRNTLGTNLRDYDDPIQSEFSKSCRKSIRQVLRAGVTYRITESPQELGEFQNIYYSTMDRDKASDFYYFDDEYFSNIVRNFRQNLLYVEALYQDKTIAAGLYFIYSKTIHIHLSGTLSEYLYLSPAYILRYATAMWGKENGYWLIHHGGGTSNSNENSLFRFKKQFANNTQFEFFVGKKIWNPEVYKQLCKSVYKPIEGDFFPAYRAV